MAEASSQSQSHSPGHTFIALLILPLSQPSSILFSPFIFLCLCSSLHSITTARAECGDQLSVQCVEEAMYCQVHYHALSSENL